MRACVKPARQRRSIAENSYFADRFAALSKTPLIQPAMVFPAPLAAASYLASLDGASRSSYRSDSGSSTGGRPLVRFVGSFMCDIMPVQIMLDKHIFCTYTNLMAYKHQSESYRIIAGRLWESWGDFNEQEALAEKARLKCRGYGVRTYKLDDGMVRLFTDRKVTS